MVQSPSWEANWFAASQEIPRITRNPKVHYRTHKRPPPVSILGQPNPVHIPTSHLPEIHPYIIHPSTPRSPQWSLSLRFPPARPYTLPPLTHTRHMPCCHNNILIFIHCCVLTVTSKHSVLLLNSNTTGCLRLKKKYLKAFHFHTLQLCTLWWSCRAHVACRISLHRILLPHVYIVMTVIKEGILQHHRWKQLVANK